MEWASGPWYSTWTSCTSEEVFLTITVTLLHSTRWAEAGYVISSTQVQLPSKRKSGPYVIKPKDLVLRTEIHGDLIKIFQHDDSDIMFNTQTGLIESWKIQGVPVMNRGIVPCFWRAPIDNDKGGGDDSYLSKWKASLIDEIVFITDSCSVQNNTGFVEIATVISGIPKSNNSSKPKESDVTFTVNITYIIYGSGDIIIETSVKPRSDLPPLPRIGIEFGLDKEMERVKWYGKGPFECYPDRKAAAQVAIHEKTVREMHVPYIVPGECGGKADVRWLTLQNKAVLEFMRPYMVVLQRCK